MKDAIAAGIKVDEFWECTPYELGLMMEGQAKRIDRELRIVAWHICYTCNVHLPKKDRLTMHKILPRKNRIEFNPNMGKDAALAQMKALQAKMKKEASGD